MATKTFQQRLQDLGSIGVLSTTNAIDGTATGTTSLYTVPAGKTAVVTGAVFRITTATAVITVATAGIGEVGRAISSRQWPSLDSTRLV